MTLSKATEPIKKTDRYGGVESSPAREPQEAHHLTRQWSIRVDSAALAAILAIFVAFFFKVIVGGKYFARLDLLNQIDAFTNPDLKAAITPLPCDPSGALIFYPFGRFVQGCWHRFSLPLWCPEVGCGYPLVGDPQSFIFSPVALLGFFGSAGAYQVGLLLEILVGCVGAFVLGRFLGLSTLAALFSALGFGFCPWVVAQVDLSGSECLFPWILLLFAWLAARPTLLRTLAVGGGCGLLPYWAHPEPAFFAEFYGVCLFLALSLFGSSSGRLTLRVLRSFLMAAGVALVALCLSAPLLLPFLEFLREAHFYKDAAGATGFNSWSNLVLSVLGLHGGAPKFCGAVAACLLPLAVFRGNKESGAVVALLVLSAVLLAPPAVLAAVLGQKPFAYLATVYGTQEFLLFLALSSGFAFQTLIGGGLSKLARTVLVASCVAVVAAALLVCAQDAHHPEAALLGKTFAQRKDLLLALGTGAVVTLLSALFGPRVPGPGLALVLLAVNFQGVAVVAKSALPVVGTLRQAAVPEELNKIAAKGARFAATGANFLLPNANIVAGFRDFRAFSPLLPARYERFLQGSGACCHNLYFYDLPEVCSPLLDVAGVRYLLTRTGVCEAGYDEGPGRVAMPAVIAGRLAPGLRLEGGRLVFDSVNKQVDGEITLRAHACAANRYALRIVLTDQHGRQLWTAPDRLIQNPGADRLLTWDVHVPLAGGADKPSTQGVAAKVVDTWTGQLVNPDSTSLDVKDGGVVLGTVEPDGTEIGADGGVEIERQYRLICEVPARFRVYENRKAVPEAYLVSNGRFVPDSEASWEAINSPDFRPLEQVILEGAGPRVAGAPAPLSSEVKVARPDACQVVIDARTDRDAYLVLTDLFYPGWRCFVDGREREVFRANYMFRAVEVPAGAHEVRFVFRPLSFLAGCGIAGACSLIFLSLAGWQIVRRRARKSVEVPKSGG